MNFSPSEHYGKKRDEFRRLMIDPSKIKKRWFRNSYVLEQTKGYTINVFVLKVGEFNPADYPGTYYGPLYEEDAKEMRKEMLRLHDWFVFA